MSGVGTAKDVSSTSLATAAIATDYFERARIFGGLSEIVLSDALSGTANGVTFGAIGVTATVRRYTLQNTVMDAGSLILFQDGIAILDTAYFAPASAVRHLPDQIEPTYLPDNEDLILGYNNAHRSYQHWLTQCVPMIDWSLRQTRTRAVRLVLPQLEPWQEDFLTLLGCNKIPRLTPTAGIRYRIPHLEYSDFLNGSTSFAVCLSVIATAEQLARAVPVNPPEDRVLYINDVNPYYGSIRNQTAVIELLRQRGVTIVEHARLGIAERINLFRSADVVIGPLGQGLADVVFCRPGALLWEWMPRHYQNASFNRLAQTAQLDYWGDLFETVASPEGSRQWEVDLGHVVKRLAELSTRAACRAVGGPARARPAIPEGLGSRPIDELMLSFESLGDNCEFGLVQRHAGIEPLGLLRFNGFHVPLEFRLQKLVTALEKRLDGLGAPGTITVFPEGTSGRRELIVRESVYQFWYHTGIFEGDAELDAQCGRETLRLNFLRRKLFEDLASGDKIWVWKSQPTTHIEQIMPLMESLRRFGPNTMLWIVEADADHAAGTIEPLSPDLIKGYIARFAPYANAADFHFASWLEVCWRADEFRHPERYVPEPEDVQEVSSPPLNAMEALSRNRPPAIATIEPASPKFAGFWRWLRRRF